MFKKLLMLLVFIVSSSYGMEQQEDYSIRELGEPRSISNHYYPADLWILIAEYLQGNDLFLNTDIARNIELPVKIVRKISQSFLKAMKKMPLEKVDFLIEIFFKTTPHLDEKHNHLAMRKESTKMIEYIKNYDSMACEELWQQQLHHGVSKDLLKGFIAAQKSKLQNFSFKEKIIICLSALVISLIVLPRVGITIINALPVFLSVAMLLYSCVFGSFVFIKSIFIILMYGEDLRNVLSDFGAQCAPLIEDFVKNLEQFSNDFYEIPKLACLGFGVISISLLSCVLNSNSDAIKVAQLEKIEKFLE